MLLEVGFYPQGSDKYGCVRAAVAMVLAHKKKGEGMPHHPGQSGLRDEDTAAYASMYGFGIVEEGSKSLYMPGLFQSMLQFVLPQYGPVIASHSLPRGGVGHPLASHAVVQDGAYLVGGAWDHALVICGFDNGKVYYLDPASSGDLKSMSWEEATDQISSLWIHDIREDELKKLQ